MRKWKKYVEAQIKRANNQQSDVAQSSVKTMSESEAKQKGEIVYNLWKKHNGK